MVKQICFKFLVAIGALIAVIPFLSAAAIGLVMVGFVWLKNRIEILFDRAFMTKNNRFIASRFQRSVISYQATAFFYFSLQACLLLTFDFLMMRNN